MQFISTTLLILLFMAGCKEDSAEENKPEGPYRFDKVILPPRGKEFWDGMATLNPTVIYHNGKYLMYYVGITYDFKQPANHIPTRDMYEEAWNTTRIGLAVATSPDGPWERKDEPILLPRSGKWDGAVTTNPAPVVHEDGFRGAVLLKKGKYYVNGSLFVPSGVVLRGEGDGADGTVLIYRNPRGTGIQVGNPKAEPVSMDESIRIVDDYIPAGNCNAESVVVFDPPTPEQYFAIGYTGGIRDVYSTYRLEYANDRSGFGGTPKAGVYKGFPLMGTGYIEHPEETVTPKSLFMQQLIDRIGRERARQVMNGTEYKNDYCLTTSVRLLESEAFSFQGNTLIHKINFLI